MPVFTDYVVDREWFCIGFSRKHRQPLWVQYRLLAAEVENKVVERSNNFHKDRVIPESPAHKDYAKTGYDRGHMAPAGDMRWSPEAMSDSFLMTNMSPQHPRCNRATWKYLENRFGNGQKKRRKLYVICGPVFAEKFYYHLQWNDSSSACLFQDRLRCDSSGEDDCFHHSKLENKRQSAEFYCHSRTGGEDHWIQFFQQFTGRNTTETGSDSFS